MRSFLTTRWRRLVARGADLRRRGPRRGSILIMVVAVLVLLALMGTAYISTARLDRGAAGPANAQTTDEVIEYLLPTVGDMVRRRWIAGRCRRTRRVPRPRELGGPCPIVRRHSAKAKKRR